MDIFYIGCTKQISVCILRPSDHYVQLVKYQATFSVGRELLVTYYRDTLSIEVSVANIWEL